MSTNAVPGAKVANNDVLSQGCWAEHEDGSMIFVKDVTENGVVVFEIYDLADKDGPTFYQHAMELKEFETQFSFDPNAKVTSQIKWTWHDKTPFPWEAIMKHFPNPKPSLVNVDDNLSAAARLARSLRLRMSRLDEDHVDEVRGTTTRRPQAAQSLWERLKGIMDRNLP